MINFNFNNLIELTDFFLDDKICKEYLSVIRWGKNKENLKCLHCEHERIYIFQDGRYRCANKKCQKTFTAISGTIFENTNLSLRKWFIAIYLVGNHKKGISSLQLARDLGITQKSAWFVLHRIRKMLSKREQRMLEGIVELDESYVGGKEKNKHYRLRTKNTQGRSVLKKTAVFGMIERGGELIAMKVKKVTRGVLQSLVSKHIQKGSDIMTDEWNAYNGLEENYNHGVVFHSRYQYVNGNIHTNTLEGFWSLLKRGILGIHHHVSRKHLDRYLAGAVFRYNKRKLTNRQRFDIVLNQCEGRLKYADLIAKE